MALLKEDGSLDVEWMNLLPIDEFAIVYFGLTQEQKNEYCSKLPLNESHGPTKAIMVDYPMETDGYDAMDVINKIGKM